MSADGRHGVPGGAGERGAAVVEMAMVVPLFFLLLFGIIAYGFIFQLRENMTHAAQEALRHALYQTAGPTQNLGAIQNAAAKDEARNRMGGTLGAPKVHSTGATSISGNSAAVDCGDNSGNAANGYLDICTNYGYVFADGSTGFQPCVNDPDQTTQCMIVTIRYDYKNGPLFPAVPLISDVLPSTLTVSATGRIK